MTGKPEIPNLTFWVRRGIIFSVFSVPLSDLLVFFSIHFEDFNIGLALEMFRNRWYYLFCCIEGYRQNFWWKLRFTGSNFLQWPHLFFSSVRLTPNSINDYHGTVIAIKMCLVGSFTTSSKFFSFNSGIESWILNKRSNKELHF